MGNSRGCFSRRNLLKTTSLVLSTTLAGCGSQEQTSPTPAPIDTDTPTSTPSPTTTATPEPDRPNIERQTILRDKAAITHLRRTISGEITRPAPEWYDPLDPDILGDWITRDGESGVQFFDNLTFRDLSSEGTLEGTYLTSPEEEFILVEYDSGERFEYRYSVGRDSGESALYISPVDETSTNTYLQKSDRDDGRTVVQRLEDSIVYEPDDATVESDTLTTGFAGSGFFLSPDGYLVTNAHVVGSHQDPENMLNRRLASVTEQGAREAIKNEYELSPNEIDEATRIWTNKFLNYYAEKSETEDVSSSIGVLRGRATADEKFETKSWPATVETTGTVYETIAGEPSWGRDIAILKIDEQEPLPTVQLGDSTDLGTGEEVFVVGYPGIGIEELFEDRNTTLEPTLTSGVVSARRTLNSGVETIQTDAGINSGNSGGPVYNSDGEVVGVATFSPSSLDIEEVAFGLPIEIVKGFMTEVGVENRSGELTTTYEEGLNALWRDDCETVEEKMNTVLDMWPNHPYAQEIIEEC